MSIYFRKPNGYYITRFKYELKEASDTNETSEGNDPEEKEESDRKPDNLVHLFYNGERPVVVSRDAISKSCHFLTCLLDGNFREAHQDSINIYLDEYTFESFEAILVYATTGEFATDKDVNHYINMIQLARFWIYDELVESLQVHLASCITIETITNIHTLANIMDLDYLKEECLSIEKPLDLGLNSLNQGWGRCFCSAPDIHHYSNCRTKVRARPEAENWDDMEY